MGARDKRFALKDFHHSRLGERFYPAGGEVDVSNWLKREIKSAHAAGLIGKRGTISISEDEGSSPGGE